MEENKEILIDDQINDGGQKSEKEKLKEESKWYIVTSITGNEDTVYQSIEDKVRAYKLEEVVHEIRLLKSREITIEVFDPINNPPPTRFRNTKTITWETLPGNRYKKTRVRQINRFPGYIYIKMIMNDQAWYIIRNTFGVTGFVGSSGKGAKPIPMSDIEVKNLFDPEMNKDIVINKTPDVYVDTNISKNVEPEKHIEFLNQVYEESTTDSDGFFDSSLISKENETKQQTFEFLSDTKTLSSEKNEKANEESNAYFEDHVQIVENTEIDEQTISDNESTNETEFESFFESGKALEKNPYFDIGNTVTIVSGPLKDDEGIVKEVDVENKKVKVLIETLDHDNIVEFDFEEVTKKL